MEKQQTAWKPMELRRVGDVGMVMHRKSGRRHDSGFRHSRRRKRHHWFS